MIFNQLLDGLAANGSAILLSSHALTEVEARTDRLLILFGGKMVATGSLPDLRREVALPVAVHISAINGYDADILSNSPNAIRINGALNFICTQDDKLATLAAVAAMKIAFPTSTLSYPVLKTFTVISAGGMANDHPHSCHRNHRSTHCAMGGRCGQAVGTYIHFRHSTCGSLRRGGDYRSCFRPNTGGWVRSIMAVDVDLNISWATFFRIG